LYAGIFVFRERSKNAATTIFLARQAFFGGFEKIFERFFFRKVIDEIPRQVCIRQR